MLVNGKMMHIALSEEDTAGYCLLPGDPKRSAKIAGYFDDARKVGDSREFTSYLGELGGTPVMVCSTGIGGPSTAIAVDELATLGVHTFIRIGTCGAMQEEILGGDVVIATAAVRQDGTTREYAPLEFPAAANFDAVAALRESAKRLKLRAHTGVVQSKDAFYGQHDPQGMPTSAELLYKWEAWKRLGVLASEMEASTLFVTAAKRRVRAGAIFHVIWNQERAAAGLSNPQVFDMDQAIRAAVGALQILAENDRGQV